MEQGKNILHMVQLATAPLGAEGLTLANETDSSHSISNGITDEMTKTGRVVAYGSNSETIELTMYGMRGDAGQEATINAIRKKVQLKIWKINMIKNDEGTYDVEFGYGIVETVDQSAGSEGFREISATVQIIGEMQQGTFATLPQEMIDFAAYGFELPGEKTGEFGGAQTEAVLPTGVTATPTTATIEPGTTQQISVVVAPTNVSNQNVRFTSSNTAIATVSPTGLVTGVTEGTATITVATVSGGRTATVAITVES